MSAPVLIVGQGLAGTALGLELEAAARPFVIASEGHATAASRVAAGLINPVTGQRFVKTWRVDELLPIARAAYARWERLLGATFWHDVEIERRFADAVEAARAAKKLAAGELAPYAAVASPPAAGEAGDALILRGGAWIDLPSLLARAEARWERAGVLRRGEVRAADLRPEPGGVRWRGELFSAVLLATGAGALAREIFGGIAWMPVKGQILTLRGEGLRAGRVWHRGVWLLGERDGVGRAGATFERGCDDHRVTRAAREELWDGVRGLGFDGSLEITGQAAGVRLATEDRLPVAGWHPQVERLGLCGALGSKGALWAPWLAQLWREEFQQRCGFPPEVSPARFMT